MTFHVELLDVRPAPWRVFEIRSTTFMDLHEAIQDACGWWNYHLFMFCDDVKEPLAGLPDEYGEMDAPDAARIKLKSFFTGVGDQCTYLYDFGDGWEHRVRLLQIRNDAKRYHRKLIAGELSFPPEDCGGIPGYEECLAIRRGEHVSYLDASERADRESWLGEWMPDNFDLVETKRSFDSEHPPKRSISGERADLL